ncbi:DHH family phosphoesterase [Breznakiella homolactica]|uniref:DHH family phosphoesterase n=1 Tax=Breznakiella homolactica TaxID=2798577 RepID=UPI0020371F05|nr:bifunctional oligoribonuclease/PAP phosphatase NrnA [Breznakiella homolactica]
MAGHKEPDGDCVGSQLVLCSLLERLGKTAVPCSSGPFKRIEIQQYESRFKPFPSEADRENARVIICDCSSPERTGDLGPYLEGLPSAVIDHHASANPAGDAVFLDTSAPSVTAMVLAVIEAFGLKPTGEEAELLLFGLCTDTGFFRHVDEKGAETFRAAARMIDAGASPKKAFLAMNGGKSLDSRILMGLVLSRAEPLFGGKLILTTEEYDETQRFGLQGRDSDTLYQLLQSVAGVEAIAVIRQETPENCTVGLRSRDAVDVSKIAQAFGGGGHKNAAGLSAAGTIADVRSRLIEEFRRVL